MLDSEPRVQCYSRYLRSFITKLEVPLGAVTIARDDPQCGLRHFIECAIEAERLQDGALKQGLVIFACDLFECITSAFVSVCAYSLCGSGHRDIQ